MTAGSFVLILAKSGTSLVVKVALSKVLTIAVKQSSVWTFIERILVLVNRIYIVSAKIERNESVLTATLTRRTFCTVP